MSEHVPAAPLILGGHSFIAQLGSDPRVSEDGQTELVAACLDRGVRIFDTTYQPERIALGEALARLGRRDEAEIIAWNFFVDFDDVGEVGGPEPYRPEHIAIMLDQLQTNRIDRLVVHLVGDDDADRRQVELALGWRREGHVGRVGLWAGGLDIAARFGADSPFSFMVRPRSVAVGDEAGAFAAAKARGWETLACSPFVRGWKLDAMARAATAAGDLDETAARRRLADRMLRYALFAPGVDKLIVAMRRADYVELNVRSAARGPLNEAETAELAALAADS